MRFLPNNTSSAGPVSYGFSRCCGLLFYSHRGPVYQNGSWQFRTSRLRNSRLLRKRCKRCAWQRSLSPDVAGRRAGYLTTEKWPQGMASWRRAKERCSSSLPCCSPCGLRLPARRCAARLPEECTDAQTCQASCPGVRRPGGATRSAGERSASQQMERRERVVLFT